MCTVGSEARDYEGMVKFEYDGNITKMGGCLIEFQVGGQLIYSPG